MIRVAPSIGCMLVGAQLLGCDVQTSRGAGGTKTGQAVGTPRLTVFEAKKRAVGVQLKAELRTARTACTMYEAENGRYPDFVSHGWSELTRYGYLPRVPTNPLSPKSVATKIVVTDQPGVTGADVDPSRAGWVFNTSRGWGGTMYAAGLSD